MAYLPRTLPPALIDGQDYADHARTRAHGPRVCHRRGARPRSGAPDQSRSCVRPQGQLVAALSAEAAPLEAHFICDPPTLLPSGHHQSGVQIPVSVSLRCGRRPSGDPSSDLSEPARRRHRDNRHVQYRSALLLEEQLAQASPDLLLGLLQTIIDAMLGAEAVPRTCATSPHNPPVPGEEPRSPGQGHQEDI